MFVGPNDYFKVVVDEFDGTTIKGWHIEDKTGAKTPNLATRSQGLNMDAVVGFACRSTQHFFTRIINTLYKEAAAQAAAK